MSKEVENILEQAERVFNKYQAIRKQPIKFDENTVLYRSELHMIDAIGKHENINVTKLSALMGITKGAVSQFVEKLSKKELILKRTSPLTDNEVVLTLTEKGQKAFDSHTEYHRKMYADFEKILGKYSPESQEALSSLLTCFECYLR